MISLKSALGAGVIALSGISNSPAQQDSPLRGEVIELKSKKNGDAELAKAERGLTQVLGRLAKDDPRTKNFHEPDALPDLHRIRHQGFSIAAGEASPVVKLLQVRSESLELSGVFDPATVRAASITIALLNSKLEPDKAISTNDLKINLKTLARLLDQDDLFKNVARVNSLLTQNVEAVTFVPADSLSKKTIREMDQIIADTGKVDRATGKAKGSDALREALVDLRDGNKVVKPGEQSEVIGYLKSHLGLAPVNNTYSEDLKFIVQVVQVLGNSQGGPQKHNDGVIDSGTLLRLEEARKQNSAGSRGISMIDVIKASK